MNRTKEYTFGHIHVTITKYETDLLWVLIYDGLNQWEHDFKYESEYFRDMAYDNMTFEEAAIIANGWDKISTFMERFKQ